MPEKRYTVHNDRDPSWGLRFVIRDGENGGAVVDPPGPLWNLKEAQALAATLNLRVEQEARDAR